MENNNTNSEFKQQYNTQSKNPINFESEKIKGFFKSLGFLALAVVVIIVIFSTFTFTVGEREQAVVTQFDKIIRVIVDDQDDPSIKALKDNPRFSDTKIQQGKGLFFKIPVLQKVEHFSNQLLTYDTSAEEVFTIDKKTIIMDNFAEWTIENPATFMVNLGSRESAHQRIDEFIYSKMREEIGKIDAHKLIADKDYMADMLNSVEEYVNSQLQPMGIKVKDIRVKRTEFPEETKPSIYEQMRSERIAVATKYRADGQKEARTIRAEANMNATVIEANAYERAQKLKGEGDAEALKIYAEAYNVDPGFYEFWKTLQTYSEVIDENTTIIISPDSPFAKYIYNK